MRAVTWTLHMDKKLGYILDPVHLRHSAVMKAGPNILHIILSFRAKNLSIQVLSGKLIPRFIISYAFTFFFSNSGRILSLDEGC